MTTICGKNYGGGTITRDPLAFHSEDYNLYRYVHNSVTRHTDPFGLDESITSNPMGEALSILRGSDLYQGNAEVQSAYSLLLVSRDDNALTFAVLGTSRSGTSWLSDWWRRVNIQVNISYYNDPERIALTLMHEAYYVFYRKNNWGGNNLSVEMKCWELEIKLYKEFKAKGMISKYPNLEAMEAAYDAGYYRFRAVILSLYPQYRYDDPDTYNYVPFGSY